MLIDERSCRLLRRGVFRFTDDSDMDMKEEGVTEEEEATLSYCGDSLF